MLILENNTHTFNISHIISQFIHYSLENDTKIWEDMI